MKFFRTFITLLFIAIVGVFISAPSKYMQSFFDGLTVWAYNVLPVLFPFAVLSTLTFRIAPKSKRSFTKALFGVSCDRVFLMSLLCGYPIGAKAISESNADTKIATRACSFCSTAGPIFIIATIGTKLLQNTVAIIIVIIVHILSAILNGLIYRKEEYVELLTNDKFSPKDFGNTITNSVLSVLSVGGLIALFYMLTDMLKSFLPQSISGSLAFSYAVGLLEMTNGIISVCKQANIATATVLVSSLLALGGACVFFQCYAFLGNKNVKALDALKMKLTQSAFATILSFILVKILL
ncbi:MAG: hypothetical protein J1F66_04660 [Clostridiales bacterium]|nr:hypothetical protein [Clostridiales bacterium]